MRGLTGPSATPMRRQRRLEVMTPRSARPLILPLASLGAPPSPARGEGYFVGPRPERDQPIDRMASLLSRVRLAKRRRNAAAKRGP